MNTMWTENLTHGPVEEVNKHIHGPLPTLLGMSYIYNSYSANRVSLT